MTSLVSSPPVPSELDDEVDDTYLPVGHVWAYPCKLPSCPDYGKSWQLRSNFLLHLQEQDVHRILPTTPAARRAIEIDWRYTTDPYLPSRPPTFVLTLRTQFIIIKEDSTKKRSTRFCDECEASVRHDPIDFTLDPTYS
jgi:hypothetical protein